MRKGGNGGPRSAAGDRVRVNWIAWYTDDRTFRSDETPWPDLPATGLLNVTVYERPIPGADRLWYRRMINGVDWLWLMDGDFGWIGSVGPIDSGEWADPPADVPAELLKRGEAVSDDKWKRAYGDARSAKEWRRTISS